jgi:predicted kinase
VILVGLPGAGKTTFYRERLSNYAHISKDMFPRHARDKQARQDAALRAALSARRSAVIDNTNTSQEERARIVDIAREFGARVVVYYIAASTREAITRNALRSGPAQVPKVAIFTCAKRLVAPAAEEGFDEVHTIRVTPEGAFVEDSR